MVHFSVLSIHGIIEENHEVECRKMVAHKQGRSRDAKEAKGDASIVYMGTAWNMAQDTRDHTVSLRSLAAFNRWTTQVVHSPLSGDS